MRGRDEHDSLRLCQHLSGACRASRTYECRDLMAAKLLRSMTDADVERCKETNSTSLGIVMFFLAFPSVLSLLSIQFADKVVEIVIPSMLAGKLNGYGHVVYVCMDLFGKFSHECLYERVFRASRARAANEPPSIRKPFITLLIQPLRASYLALVCVVVPHNFRPILSLVGSGRVNLCRHHDTRVRG